MYVCMYIYIRFMFQKLTPRNFSRYEFTDAVTILKKGNQFSPTVSTALQPVQPYRQYSPTDSTALQPVQPYRQYSQYSPTDSTAIQTVQP